MTRKRNRTKEYAQKRAAYKVGKPHGPRNWIKPMSDEELRAYRTAQPPDERDFGARFLGDPVTHRSALYAKAFGE